MPIVVWGSTLILKWVERYPSIIYIGSAVLAWTATKMIIDEPFLKGFFEENPLLKWGLTIIVIAGVLIIGKMKNQDKITQTSS